MKIGVLGTGAVGNMIASKLVSLGYEVKMGSRTANNQKAHDWVDLNGEKATAGTFSEATEYGEIIFLCVSGASVFDVLDSAGKENLKNKILIDITNPLDFSNGMPPSLSVCNTDSLGEQIQKKYPECFVIKSLNTMWCGIMVNPNLIQNGEHNVFISGNDENAKSQVILLLKEFGWKTEYIIDLGDITTARGTEMILPVWLRLWGKLGTSVFNFKIVK